MYRFLFTLALFLPLLLKAELKTMKVDYTQDGTTLEGHVFYHDQLDGKLPVMLIVHQWMGITDHELERAKAVADMGYLAFVVDIYGKGVRPQNRDQAREQATKYRADRNLMRARIKAAYDYAKTLPKADPARISCLGYCFGGGVTLEFARTGVDLQAAISFHGNLDTTTPAAPGTIKAHILVCHGAADAGIGMDQVAAFHDEMEKAKADWQLVIYAKAVHGFTHKHDPERYNQLADQRSWEHMTLLLHELNPNLALPD